MSKRPICLPELKYLQECFTLDSSCVTGLRWKTRPRHHFKSDGAYKRHLKIHAQKPAGIAHKTFRACSVKIDAVMYKAHRIVYAIYHRTTDLDKSLEMDHINRDPYDNRPENLRLISRSLNQKNRRITKQTKSNFPYIQFNYNRWIVKLSIDGNDVCFGRFKEVGDAKKVAREKSIEYDGEFSPFLNGAFTE